MPSPVRPLARFAAVVDLAASGAAGVLPLHRPAGSTLVIDELAVDDAISACNLCYLSGKLLDSGAPAPYSDLKVKEVPASGVEHGREQDLLGDSEHCFMAAQYFIL